VAQTQGQLETALYNLSRATLKAPVEGTILTVIRDAAEAAEAAEADLALCMTIHPGLSGQVFMPESLGRIERLRSLVSGTVLVQVDGGVSAQNAVEIRSAGADLLVAGSAIFWQDDPAAAYLDLAAKTAGAAA